jgi:glutaredoxin
MLNFSSLSRLSLGCVGAIAGLVGLAVPSVATGVMPLSTTTVNSAANATTMAQTVTHLEASPLHEWVAQISAELALAQHLSSIGARMYGAYWCPYCSRQEDLFGSAFSEIEYVECDPRGENAQPQLCRSAGIQGYPTWEINGQFYAGMRSLEELANLSGYSGPTNFSE